MLMSRSAVMIGIALAGLLLHRPAQPAFADALRTIAEVSSYTRTGRYDEVIRLCQTFAARYPGQVLCQSFGDSPEGRPLLALSASRDGVLSPQAAKVQKRPVVLVQAAIHGGEIEGKDAGFWLLRQMLEKARLPEVLSRITWVFVPVFNVDGHERFGPQQRPNQNGPIETGWRTTAQNLNLNRDYVKADSKEMAAMLALLGVWNPILYVDLHTTDGAEFQPDVAVTLEPRFSGPAALQHLGAALSQRVMAALRERGHLPLDFYPSFVRTDEPSSGFANELASPRFSTGYFSLWNRFAVLVETHSWKPYAQRVQTTIDALEVLLGAAAEAGSTWLAAAAEADRADLQLGDTSLALEYEHGPRSIPLRFLGYAYTQEPSAISGALRIRYDARQKEIWNIPFYPDVLPQRVVQVPAGGYIVPPAYADLVLHKLQAHGLLATRVRAALPLERADLQTFRISAHTIRGEPFEGRHPVTVEGGWQPLLATAPASIAAGSLIVPTAQRGGRLVVHLFEPSGPDSLLAWGFFSGIFEQKEYMEEYVAESVAEQMLSRDAALRQEFSHKLRTEPAFARDAQARLAFFYRRHPSYDHRQNLYPVLRLGRALNPPPAGAALLSAATK